MKTFSFPSKVSRPEKLPEPLFCDGLSLLTPNGVCVSRLPAAIVGSEQVLVKQNFRPENDYNRRANRFSRCWRKEIRFLSVAILRSSARYWTGRKDRNKLAPRCQIVREVNVLHTFRCARAGSQEVDCERAYDRVAPSATVFNVANRFHSLWVYYPQPRTRLLEREVR